MFPFSMVLVVSIGYSSEGQQVIRTTLVVFSTCSGTENMRNKGVHTNFLLSGISDCLGQFVEVNLNRSFFPLIFIHGCSSAKSSYGWLRGKKSPLSGGKIGGMGGKSSHRSGNNSIWDIVSVAGRETTVSGKSLFAKRQGWPMPQPFYCCSRQQQRASFSDLVAQAKQAEDNSYSLALYCPLSCQKVCWLRRPLTASYSWINCVDLFFSALTCILIVPKGNTHGAGPY